VSMVEQRKRLTWSELLPEYDARMHAIGETVKLFLSGKKECQLALTPPTGGGSNMDSGWHGRTMRSVGREATREGR
jgi:hypothetical protein